MYLLQNKNNATCIVTESYEEWDILIQKLKERDSHLPYSDQISKSEMDKSRKDEE
jgi:hypothetical protein